MVEHIAAASAEAAITESVASSLDRLWDLNVFLHDHMEPAFEEARSADRITRLLDQGGFRVERGLAGYPTAFRASAGPADANTTIAFLCEYDGLPPYGHSCGHNVSTAASVGAGLALAPLARSLGVRIVVIGTPGEEGSGGKYRMADTGVFDGVDAAMLVYPGMDDIAASRTLTAQGIAIEFSGKAAHAAAHPELGVNALDAMILGFSGLALLRQQLPSDVRVHGIIDEGGILPMVVPDRTSARLIVRAASSAATDDVLPRVIACFEGAAAATGASLTVRIAPDRAEVLLPNEALAGVFDEALRRVGRSPSPTDQVAGAWSGDSGYLSHVVPTIQAQVRLTERGVPPHSLEFDAATIAPPAKTTISEVATALALAGLALATDPTRLRDVRDEFDARRSQDDDHVPRALSVG